MSHPPSPGKSSGRAGHREEGGEAGAARGPEGSLGGRHAAAAGDWRLQPGAGGAGQLIILVKVHI